MADTLASVARRLVELTDQVSASSILAPVGEQWLQCVANNAGNIASAYLQVLEKNDALVKALRAHEKWEADMILDNKVWRAGEERGDCLPTITRELLDRLGEVQALRNAALTAHGANDGR